MWMAEYQFLAQAVDDIGNVEIVGFRRYFGIKNNVQQNVAQLLLNIGKVVFDDGIGKLIGFFNGKMAEAFDCLFLIPWTLGPELVHDVEQPLKGLEFFVLCR